MASCTTGNNKKNNNDNNNNENNNDNYNNSSHPNVLTVYIGRNLSLSAKNLVDRYWEARDVEMNFMVPVLHRYHKLTENSFSTGDRSYATSRSTMF